MTEFSQLPEWTCHKVVRAAKIANVDAGLPGDGPPSPWVWIIAGLADGLLHTFKLPRDIFARGLPERGDYLVVYGVDTERQYVSWSPAKEFDEGYTPGRFEYRKGDDGGFLAKNGA